MEATETTRATAAAIVRTILGVECYIALETDDLPDGVILPGAVGETGRTLDLLLRSWLIARGVWVGRRVAIFLSDATLSEMARNEFPDDPAQSLELFQQLCAAVVCHEIAHAAQGGIDLSEDTTDRQDYAKAIAACSFSAADAAGKFPPMWQHDAHFVRLAIHAAHRAWRAGWTFPINYLFVGATYGIAEPQDFEYVLDWEMEGFAKVPLFELPQIRLRHNFVQLWRKCVNYWFHSQPAGAASVSQTVHLLDIT